MTQQKWASNNFLPMATSPQGTHAGHGIRMRMAQDATPTLQALLWRGQGQMRPGIRTKLRFFASKIPNCEITVKSLWNHCEITVTNGPYKATNDDSTDLSLWPTLPPANPQPRCHAPGRVCPLRRAALRHPQYRPSCWDSSKYPQSTWTVLRLGLFGQFLKSLDQFGSCWIVFCDSDYIHWCKTWAMYSVEKQNKKHIGCVALNHWKSTLHLVSHCLAMSFTWGPTCTLVINSYQMHKSSANTFRIFQTLRHYATLTTAKFRILGRIDRSYLLFVAFAWAYSTNLNYSCSFPQPDMEHQTRIFTWMECRMAGFSSHLFFSWIAWFSESLPIFCWV